MTPRASLILLALAPAACFSPSGGTSTSASTSGASTDDSGTAAPTATGTTATTSGASETGTPTTGTSTATTASDTGSTTTGAPGGVCGDKDTQLTCHSCCTALFPASQQYIDGVAECTCEEQNVCLGPCTSNLCQDLPAEKECFACLVPLAGDPCIQRAAAACLGVEACAQYLDCVVSSECLAKPA